jgi:hypothetical protein
MTTLRQEEVHRLAAQIKESTLQKPATHALETSERVLKRITDGIYRQPSSALRELISNAYDADATTVIIETDRPRFESIIIRDNGNGLTEEALASLVCSIGGSPKRTADGSDMGVTSKEDPALSPGGRRLIGKIGIGLFAVSQLTKEFQIVTKTKGSRYRTTAHVKLGTHSEERLKQSKGARFETGHARIWQKRAEDEESHGTEVILLNLLPKTRDDLASADRWIQSHDDSYLLDEDDSPLAPPKYHIGCVVRSDRARIRQDPHLPWEDTDDSRAKFDKLVRAIHDETGVSSQNPKLVDLLDNYLRMLWTLGLQIPVAYLGEHPFALSGSDNIGIYRIGNKPGSAASRLVLSPRETIADRLDLAAMRFQKEAGTFDVFIDGIQILRPLTFRDTHLVASTIGTSLMFVGKDEPDLSQIPETIRGGSLDFEAYLFWQPKVVPVEHRGALVRISNANGTLFDETFMKYPISEQTRKTQITAEIFVNEGMDAALNIDRESFNYAHPHYQYLSKWLHNAFKQFATAHKKIGKEARDKRLATETAAKSRGLQELVAEKIAEATPGADEPLPVVEISHIPVTDVRAQRKQGKLVYGADKVLPPLSRSRVTKRFAAGTSVLERKVEAIAHILLAYGLFEDLSYEKQESLLKAIADVIRFEG